MTGAELVGLAKDLGVTEEVCFDLLTAASRSPELRKSLTLVDEGELSVADALVRTLVELIDAANKR